MFGERGGPVFPSFDDPSERDVEERLKAAGEHAEPRHEGELLPSEEISPEHDGPNTNDKEVE